MGGNESVIHNAAPQGRNDRDEDHPGISGGKLRAFIEMPENLVASSGVAVVVGMSLEIEQETVRQIIARVP